MNDLTFYYVPKSIIKLEVTSTTITKFYSKYLNESLTEINSDSEYKMLMNAEFRKCIMGEYYISSLKMLINMFNLFLIKILISRCQQCSQGQYSFEDGMKATGCKKCPPDADLCYGAVILIKKGFQNKIQYYNFLKVKKKFSKFFN